MFEILTAIYVAFTVCASYWCGFTLYEYLQDVKWMKNQDLLCVIVGILIMISIVKYGWPIYEAAVIKVFA